MTAIMCPVPGCGTILRSIAGIHCAGEPPFVQFTGGNYVTCPGCKTRLPWPLTPELKPASPTPSSA